MYNNILNKHIDLLKMMKDLHSFCEEKGITYSLTGGSLLGAIRENGFIEWDTDVDIMIDRKNFQKLQAEISLFKGYVLTREQWLFSIKKEKSCGEDEKIDIFILDKVPLNPVIRKTKLFVLYVLQGMLKTRLCMHGFGLKYKLCLYSTYWLGKLFPKSVLQMLYDKVSALGNNKIANNLAIYNDSFKQLTTYYSSETFNTVIKHKFEDEYFYVTSNYHNHLTIRYGNYMIPDKY